LDAHSNGRFNTDAPPTPQVRPPQAASSPMATSTLKDTIPKGLTLHEWTRLSTDSSLRNAVCRNFLRSRCTSSGECPRQAPHLSIAEVKKLL
jgi:hypothetical protein